MDKTRAIRAVAAACAALVFAGTGCGKAGPEAVQETAAALAQVAKAPEDEAREAAETALAALKEGRMDEVYAALPASWQDDMSRVAAAYAGKVDPELAKAVAAALSAVGSAMEAQADHLAELALKTMGQRMRRADQWEAALDGMPAEDVENGIRAAGMALRGIVDWFSVEKLAKGDLRGLLADSAAARQRFPVTGADGAPFRLAIRPAEAAEAPADGGVALMLGNDDDGWKRVELRKVEGRWVPAELADGWRGAMDAALAKAAEFEIPEKDAARARQVLPALQRMAESLAGAKSAEELEGSLQGAMVGAAMLLAVPLD